MTGAQIAARAILPPRGRRDALMEGGFRGVLYAALALAVAVLVVLVADVLAAGAPALSPELLTAQPSKVRPESSGVQSAILGTVYLMGLCFLFVVPIGVATAVYLEEYADQGRWWNRLIEVNIQNLSAVPSVVYGILGLAFVVRGPLGLGPVLLAGAITLSLLVLPVVIIVAREAIRAVPPSIREGALALGATRWQTIWRQVLPGSIAGIATGVILALSRAIGETAPLIVIGAAVSPRFNPDGLLSSFTALPMQIFGFSKDNDPRFLELAAASIVILMVLLLCMNSLAIWLRNRYEQRW